MDFLFAFEEIGIIGAHRQWPFPPADFLAPII
jgi:hypothetical protein